MPLLELAEFIPGDPPRDTPVFNVEVIPKEMDIFFRAESDFLPPGKTFADLTPAEIETMKHQYRFSPLRPGIYQTLTGIGAMI